ncbi:MAG: hypothetical protein HPZ91_03100 [Lentisphaeria bacterium]|nr:hypothetical protein [Lentisphaeria bacterium]
MKHLILTLLLSASAAFSASPLNLSREELFSLADAYRESSGTRERICLNGYWEFQPAAAGDRIPPAEKWGYFLLPGSWTTSLGSRKLHITPQQKKELKDRAWFRREVEIPESWRGRRILLDTDLVQTQAQVFVDGRAAGELFYPGGEFELTTLVEPGRRHEIALLVSAPPGSEKGVYMAPGRIIPANSKPDNMGILGDLYLVSRPKEHAVGDVHVITSFRRKSITFDTGFANLAAGKYRLRCEVKKEGRTVRSFTSALFTADGSPEFRFSFGGRWEDPELWDTDAPENLYTAGITLLDASGRVLDVFLPEEFGFREFYTAGRDFYLNGRKIHLRAFTSFYVGRLFPATEERVGAMCRTARSAGYNFMICGNYNYNPGRFSYYGSLHRVASKLGMLSSVTLPHFSAFDRRLHDPAVAAEYRRQSAYIIRKLQNIPGAVMYAMNHNAMGYRGDQNPLLLGQRKAPAPEDLRNVPADFPRRQGKIAETIARELDPSRPVYHHSGARLGDVYTVNCYLNWIPDQERSDYLETWEAKGDMPLFFVEWGLPHVASWSSYRGPEFIWSCRAVQAAWIDEYNSMILGEEAYRPDAAKLAFLKTQEKALKGNTPVNYNVLGGNTVVAFLDDVHKVRAALLRSHIRDMRARGISGILPWDQGSFWTQQGEVRNRPNPLSSVMVKRPGIVDEVVVARGGALGDPLNSFELSPTGEALAESFREELGWIGGRADEFTEKSHSYRPGETVRKSLVMLNDTRQTKQVKWRWRSPELRLEREGVASIEPGGRVIEPVEFALPGGYEGETVTLEAEFSSGCRDRFEIEVASFRRIRLGNALGVFDPEGTASPLLKQLGVPFRPVRSERDMGGIGLFIVGRNALGRLPFDLSAHLGRGVRILVLEQSADTLERLGIRCAEYAARTLFPVGRGRMLRDWRGAGTALPAYYPDLLPTDEPKFKWQGFSGTRVWRAGNRGTVASVLPEKPPVGDWMPLYQCGFALQYAPLMHFREGNAQLILCQLDLSGRTEVEPEALRVLGDALERLDRAPAPENRRVACLGGRAQALLRQLKIPFQSSGTDAELLVVGPGAEIPAGLAERIEQGLNVLAFDLSGEELSRILPGLRTVRGRYCTMFPELDGHPEFTGLSAADIAWRDGQEFDAFSSGSPLFSVRRGRGLLAVYQLPPWKFDAAEFYNRAVTRRSAFTAARLLYNLGAPSEPGFIRLLTGNITQAAPQLPADAWKFRADPEQRGIREKWHLAATPMRSREWLPISVERHFQHQLPKLAKYNGHYFYRLEFNLTPEELRQMRGTLHIGPVDDESWIYLNDALLGEVTAKSHPDGYWREPRSYRVTPEQFRAGRNVLVIHGNDIRQTGGLSGAPGFVPDEKPGFYTDVPVAGDHPYRYYRW